MISVVIYYIASASAVFFYGIGLGRTMSLKDDSSKMMLSFIKALSTVSSSTAVGYLVNDWLLAPIGFSEIYPFVTLLIFLVFSIIIEIFIGVGIKKSSAEFSVTILCTLLALGEGVSLGHAVVISVSCVFSFYLLIFIFYAIRNRVSFYTNPNGIKIYPVLFVSLAAVIIAICGWNISWLNVL